MLEYFTWITANLVLASNSIFGGIQPPHEQLQVPQCLAAEITIAHDVLAENDQFKIIEVLNHDVKQMTLLADQVNCGDVLNVSNKLSGVAKKQLAQNLLQKNAVKSIKTVHQSDSRYVIKHQKEVNAALKEIIPDNIWQTLNHLTAYSNRSATKDTGVDAANWLKSKFETMAIEYGRADTNAYFVDAGWYKQPSLVTVIGKDKKGPGIVIGAHMDTLDGSMPGADEGSGSATIMEVARVLMASKVKLKHPVYIIWYAAGSRDLAGSQYVVQYFQDHSIPINAVAQFDKTGYRVDSKNPTMWIFSDFTDNGLSSFMAHLITNYIHVPIDYSRCGYRCSDHISWNEEAIPAAYTSESNLEDFNPYIGTSSDTMDLLNLDHMTNFTKLALAFAIELASE